MENLMNNWNLPPGKEPHRERYLNFILSRLERPTPEGFTERHHILPKALGGKAGYTEKENLVVLTPREHYIAHLMLWKAYGGKMASAFHVMVQVGKGVRKLTGRQYSRLRVEAYNEGRGKRISEALKGRKLTEEHKEKLRLAKLGKKQDPAVVAKRATTNTGKTRSAEAVQRISAGNLGKSKHGEESRRKIAEANRLRGPQSEETKQKRSLANKGQKRSEEVKEKMRAAARLREERKRLSLLAQPALGEAPDAGARD